jgi:hypothetical protein
MKSTKFLTISMLTIGLLAATAFSAFAGVQDPASHERGSSFDTAQQSHLPDFRGKPPKNPTATPEPTAPPEPCVGCPAMFVEVVNVNASHQSRTVSAGCLVRVVDDAGNKVDGAMVTIEWSGAVNSVDSGLTELQQDGDTYARILVQKSARCRKGPQVFTCTVTQVSKSGLDYTPSLNVETTDSDDACGLP